MKIKISSFMTKKAGENNAVHYIIYTRVGAIGDFFNYELHALGSAAFTKQWLKGRIPLDGNPTLFLGE